MYHEINILTADACDFVLCGCPLSALKFQEKGYNSIFMPMETNGDVFKKYEMKKVVDVLYFGDPNVYRQNYINYLKDHGINIKQVSRQSPETAKDEDLVKLINKSKIVINFSRSEPQNKKFASSSNYNDYFQLKGRVYQTGLCGTLCVTEYAPPHELIFNDEELVSFQGKEDCVNIIKKLLACQFMLI